MKNAIIPARSLAHDREDQLQTLRFLAFLNIFISHAEMWVFFQYPSTFCGIAAVSFFFVLSGMLTGYSAYGKETHVGIKECGRYMWKKLKKLYPLYFATTIWVAMSSGIPDLIGNHSFADAWGSLRQLLRNLLLLQSWFPEGYLSFNGVGWYLSVLVFLYVLNLPAGWLLNRINKHRLRYFIFFVAFGGSLFATAAYCYVTQSLDMQFWHFTFPPARMGEYFSGMIMGYVIRAVKQQWNADKAKQVLFTILEAAALIFWFVSLRRPGNYWMNKTVSWLIPNLFVCGVFALGMGWISQLFRWRPLVRLGDVSFECFLLHHLIILRYLGQHEAHISTQLSKMIAFAVCLLFTLLLAFLLNKDGKRGTRHNAEVKSK